MTHPRHRPTVSKRTLALLRYFRDHLRVIRAQHLPIVEMEQVPVSFTPDLRNLPYAAPKTYAFNLVEEGRRGFLQVFASAEDGTVQATLSAAGRTILEMADQLDE